MKILLVGEYSGVHIKLARALRESGHSVTLLSTGDSFKNFERDISIVYRPPKNFLLRKFLIFADFLGVKGLLQYLENKKTVDSLVSYDIVQLINPVALDGYGSLANLLFLRKLKSSNKNIFLCALGDDYYWVKAARDGAFRYSAMDNLSLRYIKPYLYPLKYRYGLLFPTLNRYAIKISKNVIPGLYDYKVAYSNVDKCTDIVRLPIESSRITQNPTKFTAYPIKIFHGWQVGKEPRKGNKIFDEAVALLKEKYGNKVHYEVAKSIPYEEYVEKFKNCHVFLDQCFSYDMGMNALLGLAAGKVTLTGVEREVVRSIGKDYGTFAVNAIPDVQYIFDILSEIVERPEAIETISAAALKFVREQHEAHVVARQYEAVWLRSLNN